MKGMVFDLDGVLTDTASFHFQAWQHVANKIGISIDSQFNEKLKGISRMDSLRKILEYGLKINRYTVEEQKALAEEKNVYYLQLLEHLSPSDLLPGVRPFLTKAKQKNIPCGIASASKNARFILKKLEIEDFFEIIVDPNKLKKGKPDPEIFNTAAKMLGISSSEIVGFEDSQAGIEGMKACGMFAIGIGTETSLVGADEQFTDFEQIEITKLINKKSKKR